MDDREARSAPIDAPALRAAARVAPLVAADRLRLARDLRACTQQEVAERAGGRFSAAALSQLEKGASRPSPSTLAALAEVLAFPVEFFVGRPNDLAPEGFFRSLRSTSVRERRRQLGRARLLHDFVTAVEEHVRLPEVDVPEHQNDLNSDADSMHQAAEEAAETVRRRWGLGHGPIPQVIRELERHGIVVVRAKTFAHEVDAFSVRFPGRPIAVLGSDKAVTARSRFDAAHELGHFVLHSDTSPGSKEIESQAHHFAAAFLMPRSGIEHLLPSNADWPRLAELKVEWRVSIAALLMRARTLGVMTPARYTSAMKAMSARGWRHHEPGDERLGALEMPVLLRRAVQRLDETGITLRELCENAALPLPDVESLLDVADDPRPTVDL
jgi:Zn-dependent peptidase ImmA (M78 family)/transcriptional regulator with XRE-family HTH domain